MAVPTTQPAHTHTHTHTHTFSFPWLACDPPSSLCWNPQTWPLAAFKGLPCSQVWSSQMVSLPAPSLVQRGCRAGSEPGPQSL